MVRLDSSGRPFHGNGLNNIGVKRSLNQVGDLSMPFCLLEVHGLFGEDRDELRPDNFALFLRVSNALEPDQEAFGGVHTNHAQADTVAQHVQGLLELIFPEKAGIDENIREAVADGTMNQHGGHSGVHATAQRANGAAIPYSLANGHDSFLDEGGAAPLWLGFANPEEKIPEDLRALVGVLYLRMELHAEHFRVGIFYRGDGVFSASGRAKPGRQADNVITMAVPDAQLGRKLGEEF